MTSTDASLDPNDIDPAMSQEAEQAIRSMVFAWPNLEYALSEWLISLCDLSPDVGRIIIGNMDTKTKIDRLVTLAGHFKREDEHGLLKMIRGTHQHAVDIRNTIIHTPFLGMRKSVPNTLVFGGKRHLYGDRGRLRIEQVTIKEILTATSFAFSVNDAIEKMLSQR